VVYTLGDHTLEVGGETRTYGWGEQTVPYIDTSYFSPAIKTYFLYVGEGFEGQETCLQYHALYAQDTWKLLKNLDLEFGLRGEWFEADEIDSAAFGFPATAVATTRSESNLDPRLAIRYRPWQGGELGLRFGITHRYPNSPEYFWWYLNRGTGYFNTELNPERAIQYEIGFEQKFGQTANLALRGYYYDVSDYISSTTVSGVGTVVYNIEEVKIYGAELEGVLALPWNLLLRANLTLQEAEKDGDPWDVDNQATNQLSNFPNVMANLGLDFHPDQRWRAGVSLNFVGTRDYMSGGEAEELSSYLLLNCHASYRFLQTAWGSWDALLMGFNLLDRDYELESGYSMPGLTFMGGLRYSF
jgi:outer membrane receptor protein involved in Fe transport